MNLKKHIVFLLTVFMFVGVLTGCTNIDDGLKEQSKGTVRLGLVEWADAIAVVNTAAVFLEDYMNYDVEITVADIGPIYTSVANSNTDAYLPSWLPYTHISYINEYQDNLELLVPVNENGRSGLVVPEYVDIDSIEDLNDHVDMFDGKIIGVEAGGGIMNLTEEVIDKYGLEYELITSSEAAMTARLSSAINNKEPVVITGWAPHWKFADYDLKFLDDPQLVYGEAEKITPVVRLGLEEDMPEVYEFFNNFTLTSDELNELIARTAKSDNESEAVRTWMNENEEVVARWME